MIIQFIVCAQNVSVDRFTNKLSIFNVIDRIVAPSLPLWISELTVAASFLREGDEPIDYVGSIELALNHTPIVKTEVRGTFRHGPTSRMIVNFPGLPIQSTGLLSVTFALSGVKSWIYLIPVEPVPTQKSTGDS